jgi:hypothetical protein
MDNTGRHNKHNVSKCVVNLQVIKFSNNIEKELNVEQMFSNKFQRMSQLLN